MNSGADNFDQTKRVPSRSMGLLYIFPIFLLLGWLTIVNFGAVPFEGKVQKAKLRAMILGNAIIQYRRQNRINPASIEQLRQYLLYLDEASGEKRTDNRENYFEFSMPSTGTDISKRIDSRIPSGMALQAGFNRLPNGDYVVLGVGPDHKPVLFGQSKKKYLTLDDDAFKNFQKQLEGE